MIIFDGLELIGLAIGAAILLICGISIVIDRIDTAVKRRRQKRAAEAQEKDSQSEEGGT